MFEHTQCTEYIVEQRERCIRLSNSRHEDRIRQHEQASDLQYIHKHINDVYTRMGLKTMVSLIPPDLSTFSVH